jgi:hypothetical protein
MAGARLTTKRLAPKLNDESAKFHEILVIIWTGVSGKWVEFFQFSSLKTTMTLEA